MQKTRIPSLVKGGSIQKVFAASVIVSAAMLAGCSEDVTTPDDGYKWERSSETATFGADPSAQANRVKFYGNAVARRVSRAVEDFPAVGSAPVIPAGTPSYDTPNAAQQDWQNDARKVGYELKGGNGQIEVYGNGDVYITGDVTTHNINQNEWGKGTPTIYVMPGASLTLSANIQDVIIKAFGELKTADGRDITLGKNAQVLVDGNFTVNGRFAVEGVCVVEGDLDVLGQLQVTNGSIKAKCLAADDINMSGGGEVAATSYLHSNNALFLGQNATVDLYAGAMARVEGKTTMTAESSRFVYCDPESTSAHALLWTEELHVEGAADNPVYVNSMFAHELKADFTTFTNCQPATYEDFLPAASEYRIPKEGCNPGHATEEPEKPSFDPIATIEPPTHTHDYLSATCVQAANGKAYVSYHLNEAYGDITDHTSVNKHQGCVEVYEVDATKAEITSWLLNEDHDFNHLIVDGDKVYTTGDKKAGGQLGIINLVNGQFGQQSTTMETVKLNGTSGNCIIRDGASFRIATNYGFQSLDATTYEESGDFIATDGSAKHLASGNGVIVTLNLDQRGVTSSPATVSVYRNGWGEPAKTFAVANDIKPINGKNTIALSDGYIYVCLGENGVQKYDLDGNKCGEYNWKAEHSTSKGNPCANGLAVDDKYLYVAYGGAGLYVFDKLTMSRVARYYHKSGDIDAAKYSANYVALVGPYIYISYGRNGLEVVKMNVPNN